MPLNLRVESAVNAAAQVVKDQNGNTSALTLSTNNVGIGTTTPTQRLTLGSGNLALPTASAGVSGNLYFGGVTDTGQIGMRMFGGRINEQLQSGFIDVRAGTPTDGLVFRVDTFSGAAERMRITASGNIGINTPSPAGNLHIGGAVPDIFLGGHTVGNQDGLRVHYNQPLRTATLDAKGASFRVRGESGAAGGGASDRLFIDLTNGNVGIGHTAPAEKLVVEGNVAVSGDVLLTGADCAEDFDVLDARALEPGTVMVIGDEGRLHESSDAYDTRVAGVLSGAGDYRPGIVLDKQQARENRLPVALTGKTFCKVDAQYGPIRVGDLLTTSPTAGHAMRADDPLKASGAVIGKALRPLEEGQGLIPILIALH